MSPVNRRPGLSLFGNMCFYSELGTGGAEFVHRTKKLLAERGPSALQFVDDSIMKPSQLYLFAYNAVQFIGWGIILLKTLHGLSEHLTWPQLYTSVEAEVKLFQTLAILEARESIGVPMLLLAWSVTEVVRYSYYALGLFNAVPYFLTWIRWVAEKKYYSLEMPNALNMSISFYWVLIGAALFYIPGFPQLYLYMFAQRKKVLSTDAAKKKM
ncbi:tyrosine phosphatase-like protein, PTPLA [Ostertagia ostertagi]